MLRLAKQRLEGSMANFRIDKFTDGRKSVNTEFHTVDVEDVIRVVLLSGHVTYSAPRDEIDVGTLISQLRDDPGALEGLVQLGVLKQRDVDDARRT
jgi:hypothetical protein